jgi:hypothetical protein
LGWKNGWTLIWKINGKDEWMLMDDDGGLDGNHGWNIELVAYNDGKSKRFSVVSPLQLEFDVVVHYYKFWCLIASLWDLYNMIIPWHLHLNLDIT